MKKTFSLFIVLLFMSFGVKSFAQVAAYTFSQASGTYTAITGGTVVATSTGTSGAASIDDVNFPSQTIPFTFAFSGVGYTSYTINSNGYITFGATLPPTGSPYTPISSTVGYSGAIAGIGRDIQAAYSGNANRTSGSNVLTNVFGYKGVAVGKLITGTGIPTTTTITAIDVAAQTITMSANATSTGTAFQFTVPNGELRSETIGTTPNQVHVIQWSKFRKFGTQFDVFNFQIKLYETSNKVEIIYNVDTSNSTNAVPQVGLRGSSNADFNNRTTITDWTASTAGGVNTATMALTNAIFPPSGHTYIWTAPSITIDVGPSANIAPTGSIPVGSTPIVPSAKVKNYQTGTQTFMTVYKITGPVGYQDSVSTSVVAGGENTLVFPGSFNPNTSGSYNVTIYTELATDQNRFNDTLKTSFTVLPNPNSGSDSGYFYANNLATTLGSFPTYCWKDTSGSKSLLVNGAVSAGATLVGSRDDGYFVLSLKNILLSMNQDTTNRHLRYNGVCFDSIFPGTNGIIGLTQKFGSTSISTFAIDGLNVAKNALLPLWHDFDLETLTFQFENRVSYKVAGNQLIITYDKVASFAPENDWTSFQVVIEIVTGCTTNSNFRYTYADTTTGQSSGSFVSDFLASYNAAPNSITTFRNHVVGYSMNGGPIAYSAYCSPANNFAGPNALYVPRTIFNTSTKRALTVEFGSSSANLSMHDCVSLTVRLSLEGLQSNLGPRARDTVEVQIREGSAAPYNLIQKSRIYLDSTTNQKGIRTLDFSSLKRNVPYYIVVSHRNSIRSWSVSITPTGSSLTYDFTVAKAATFGGNSVLVNGNWSFFSGDVTQDGIIDGSDAALIDNDAYNFIQGDYVLTDLNWDGIVDGSDAALVDNNAFNFVGEVAPPGARAPSAETSTVIKYDYVPSSEIIVLPDPYARPKVEPTK